MAAAIALTGVSMTDALGEPEKASAQYLTSVTDYNGLTLDHLHNLSGEAPYSHSLSHTFVQKTHYNVGDRMSGWLIEAGHNKFDDLHVKYYYIQSNGTLSRYKTVYGTDLELAFYEFTWTSAYPKGQYAIVYTYRDDDNRLRSAYKKVYLQ